MSSDADATHSSFKSHHFIQYPLSFCAYIRLFAHIYNPHPANAYRVQLHRQSHRSAFLAPFGVLYDALHEVRESKKWLTEQLTKVLAMQMGFDAAVESAVEQHVCGLREEVMQLQRRVEELESSHGMESGLALWRWRSVANSELNTSALLSSPCHPASAFALGLKPSPPLLCAFPSPV